MLYAEIMEGKHRMSKKPYCDRFPSTAATALRLQENSAYSGLWTQERKDARDEKRKEFFHADSWFASAIVAEEFALRGHEFIGPVRTMSLAIPRVTHLY